MTSTSDGSKRGAVNDRRRSSNASSRFAVSVRSEPWIEIALGGKAQLDRLSLEPLVKRLRIEIAGAFVEQ